MSRRRSLLVVAGVLSLLVAGLLVVPGRVPGPLAAVRDAADAALGGTADTLAWLVALVALAYAAGQAYRARDRPTSPPPFAFETGVGPHRAMTTPDAPAERADDRPRTLDDEFRATLRAATAEMEHAGEGGAAVRDRLRAAAVETVRRGEEGTTRSAARAAVAAGEWTDDPVAAAFLADDVGPSHPPAARVRGWLRPAAAFERRVDRTIGAIHARTPGVEATPGQPGDGAGEAGLTATRPGGDDG